MKIGKRMEASKNRRQRGHIWLIAIAAAATFMGAPAYAQGVDELINEARSAARTDDNRRSADLFERAIAAAPERASEWTKEYADQLTYSGRAALATRLYREYLANQTDPALRKMGLQGLALSLSWSGSLGEAQTIYEQLVALDTGNIEYQRNLGKVIAWSGRQREAQVYFREFLKRFPGDAEGRLLLAQSQWWLGRPDVAKETLSDLSATDNRTADSAKGLAVEMAQAAAPQSRIDFYTSSQSDHLDISTTSIEHQWTSLSGLTMIAPRLQSIRYLPADGSSGVSVERPGAKFRHRVSDAVEINAEVASDEVRPGGLPAYRRFTYNTWATWWPNDSIRVDLSADRVTFDNVRSLQRRIVGQSVGGSLDWMVNERNRVSIRLARADYSDGNGRISSQVDVERQFLDQPALWGGLRCTRFDFSRQLNNGYFNPDHYSACLVTLRARGTARAPEDRFSWDLKLAKGHERAVPDGKKPVYELGASAAYRLGRDTSLEFQLQRFSSLTGSSGGFARTTAGITLVHRWGAN